MDTYLNAVKEGLKVSLITTGITCTVGFVTSAKALGITIITASTINAIFFYGVISFIVGFLTSLLKDFRHEATN
jgi:hypothetical protein